MRSYHLLLFRTTQDHKYEIRSEDQIPYELVCKTRVVTIIAPQTIITIQYNIPIRILSSNLYCFEIYFEYAVQNSVRR